MFKKKGQITIFVIIAIFLVGNVVLIVLLREKASEIETDVPECNSDAECVREVMCNAKSCVHISKEPSYSSTFSCDVGVQFFKHPYTRCACVDRKCEATI
jgi:hypothetical protein